METLLTKIRKGERTHAKLSDFIRIKHGFAFKGEYFSNQPTTDVLVTPGNFSIGGGFKADKFKYYKGSVPENYVLKENDLVVTMTDLSVDADTLGYSALVPNDNKNRFLHNQRVGLVQKINDGIDFGYLYYLMRTRQYQKYVVSTASGSTVKHTSPDRITSYEYDFPKLPVQKKIAEILSGHDAKIENNNKKIKNLEEMIHTIFNEWFVHFRFPGYSKVKMISSEMGEIPEGWEISTLDMVSQINSESIKKCDGNKIINYIDIASVSTGKIETVQPMLFSEAPGRARRIVRHGDIIWSTVRPNRKSYSLIINPEDDLIASTGFAVIRPTKISYPYIYQAVTSDSFVGYLVNRARGSAYPAVTGVDFERSPILIPDRQLLDSFDKIATPLHEYIEVLSQENKNLSKIRDLLIPQLFNVTGY